ncbi:sugar O-acetyltransferase [Photobacterium sp. DNB23_23_1]|uniref:Acetyltransferase n=1 Tax=Photobacterium pectinilyticum TaxID=2906793 RepID=A0ABT1N6E5_9GAMM|nr:sugar O-acetyltransferase [Photobacterium sp. ZSDE20]MCQ1060320.1 sugar O-acetyltransferase [Photobacterium sp. ZSDE20]MDD1828155.1 sugar O-acetyltransferase [Photobacterium sp. ZSDE20]
MAGTEKQKMISGEMYQAWDEELVAERQKAKKLCFALNQTCPTEEDTRKALINELLSKETDAWIESPFYCDYGYNLKVGKAFYANHGCTILDCAPINIGDNCMLAPGVVIATAGHPLDPVERASGEEFAKKITIGNDVWLGANATVCPGVTIGDNVVVGAGSVVTKDLPANTVCVGSPAKPVRTLALNGDKSALA